MSKFTRRLSRFLLLPILILALVLGGGFYVRRLKATPNLVYSPVTTLNALWREYKLDKLEPGTGRTLDKQRNNITTSEGQSYTMLRAVWVDDQQTFDQEFTWTRNNLKRPNDHLSSWLFGQRADGSYGVITNQGGQNTASDADTDMALSLLFAYARWDDSRYLTAAQSVIGDIWNEEVVTVAGQPVMTASNVSRQPNGQVLVNPSYFSSYAYRLFAKFDPKHNWLGVVNSSYDLLNRSTKANFNNNANAGLPPDWFLINPQTGQIQAPTANNLDTNYGFDAFRIPWRLYLDWQWYQDGRARSYLSQMSFLGNQWNQNQALYPDYSHSGARLSSTESEAMYGASLPYFMISSPTTATQIYQDKLLANFDQDTQTWRTPLGYYDDNWAWFGIAAYNQMLPNLAANIKF